MDDLWEGERRGGGGELGVRALEPFSLNYDLLKMK